ncbi:tctex1 domain-containing protein 1-like [Mizuhopecten yessoensis]|uniref:Tctex1 domain-containing protein 1 n=1 Tax=Mizuhopecten yessoensis TaxID=6573 RepID=A0A210QJA4_MIZYE|nr:tctex1 domain-containing protein 1-like [Mizuhopecten yessoensis]OWF48854.1 Tctex1 domain-containing protein 1 [Mizuhopecten yessoensis]
MDIRPATRSVSTSNLPPKMGEKAKTAPLLKSNSSYLLKRQISTISEKQKDVPVFSERSGPSFVGLLASKRLAKRLTSRILAGRTRSLLNSRMSGLTIQKEPSYRMEPKESLKFNSSKVEKIANMVLEDRLAELKYNPRLCSNISRLITEEIKDRVKTLKFDRYKIIVIVFIGENKDQGVQISSRCAWDDEVDNFATCTYKTNAIYATATVYGVYNE